MTEQDVPRLSIVLAIHNQAELLERNLPQYLTQQSNISYEVIVVDDGSTDETPDVLNRLKKEYPNLYTTFLPHSTVPTPSRTRLALTVGAKATHGTWVALADISRPPVSEKWLENLVGDIGNVVMVYTALRRHDTITIRQQSWASLDDAALLMVKAERRSGRGHHGRWQRYRRGIYDAVSVRREYMHQAIRLFDQPIHHCQLLGLRMRVYWKNLFY